MNSPRLFVLLAVIGMMSFSCQQRTDVAPVQQNRLTELELAEHYLADEDKPPVLFQYARYNEDTRKLDGFLIDRAGVVRTFQFEEAPFEYLQFRPLHLNRGIVDRLLEASTETRLRVDLIDLARRVRAVHRRVGQNTEARRDNPTSRETLAFYAYVEAGSTSGTGCGGGVNTQNETRVVLQMPLLVEGKKNLINTSDYVREMVTWLTEFIPETATK